jgi:hypothetical protein
MLRENSQAVNVLAVRSGVNKAIFARYTLFIFKKGKLSCDRLQ